MPNITGTVVKNQGVILNWKAVAGAQNYQVQLSKDGGEQWEVVKDDLKANTVTLSSLTNDTKIHLRVLAKGQVYHSIPSTAYPVYVTAEVPHAPEGLLLKMDAATIKLSWGSILGAGSYRLYRKTKNPKGKSTFVKIYEGILTSFEDEKPIAGLSYEYVVTAINGNGESKFSTITDTDPSSFLNWEPKNGEGFRRDTEDHENGFLEFNPFIEDQKSVLQYPIKKS